MKEFLLAILILVAAYFGLNFYNKTNTVKQLDLSSAISQCSKNLSATQCSIDSIQRIIADTSISQNTNKNQSYIVWTADNKLVDLSSLQQGDIMLNLSKLTNHQIVVWNSHLEDSKRKQGGSFMNDNSAMGIGVLIILFIGVLWIIFAVIPFIWRFFLNRVSEVSKAVKGEKVD
jgi:cytoskeletal protein RodZ